MDLQAQPSSVRWQAGRYLGQQVLAEYNLCSDTAIAGAGVSLPLPGRRKSLLSPFHSLCSLFHLWAACPPLCFAACCVPFSQHLP